MADRALATIRRIGTISDIKGKDMIGLAMVDGWSVIVRKADYKEGDKCIFCEIDSILPEAEWTAFLKDRRIKTMKMAGVLSQGICFPTSILPGSEDLPVGTDITKTLGVTQWVREDHEEKIESAAPKKKYPKWLMRYAWFRKLVYKPGKEHTAFPSFISKTDEERIQNAPFYIEDENFRNQKWLLTEKVDGQSGTFCVVKRKILGIFPKYEFIVCSRNRRLPVKDNSSYWSVAERYNIEKALTDILKHADMEWVAIQGEIIGPGIQGNKYHRGTYELYCFNYITPYGRIGSDEGADIMMGYGINWVPMLHVIAENLMPRTVEYMLKAAHGYSCLQPGTLREGLVCRTMDGKHSFKAVDPEFLIKHNE